MKAAPAEASGRWLSFDALPGRHPWLSSENLARAREFSRGLLAEAREVAAPMKDAAPRFAFVGNMANNLYLRAAPLRKRGLEIDMFVHPQDHHVMSQPAWEEFDGLVESEERDATRLRREGVELPEVAGTFQPEVVASPALTGEPLPAFVSEEHVRRWPAYFAFVRTLEALQPYDALIATQTPYLALLARKPYLVTDAGGDLWYDCARGDELGSIQNSAFRGGRVFLVNYPWSYAHARRYGMHHLVNLPLILDEEAYRPGQSPDRAQWMASTSGRFFVLSTCRMDDFYKGTDLALEGFARFAQATPQARLIVVGWGEDLKRNEERLQRLGIRNRVLTLPLAGKRRLVRYLQAADCLLDQFAMGYYGATAIEAMACAVPVVMRIETAQYAAHFDTGPPPVLCAASAGEVANHLSALARDPDYQRAVAADHRRWFMETHSAQRWTADYRAMLTAIALGHRFSFDESPLTDPLTDDEREYHARQLAQAPAFPNYR